MFQSLPRAADQPAVLSGPFAALAPLFPRFSQALTLHANGELDRARELYLSLMERPRLTAACLHQLASLASQRSEHELAVELFRHSLRLDPSILATYSKLANALSLLGQGSAALAMLLEQGCVLQLAERYADAEVPYRELLSHDPLNYGAYVNLGTCLTQLRRLPEATQQIFRAMQLYGRLDQSVAAFARELGQRIADKVDMPLNAQLPPGSPTGRIEKIEDAITTLGKIMGDLGLLEEAALCHRQAVAIAPGFALGHWNLALALLAVGNYAEGWTEYEWRWHWSGFPGVRQRRGVPVWTGQALHGKKILVCAEQGFGDTLQFAPLVSRLADMGAEVSFEVMRPLVKLMAQSLDGIAVVETSDTGGAQPPLGEFDFAVANISLPAILRIGDAPLPLATNYLRTEPGALLQWAKRLGVDKAPRVGITWAGRAKPDARRSIPFALLTPLFDRRTVAWYSLQVDPERSDIPQSGNAAIQDLAPDLADFSETAAAIANLDLVITIDTAVAHLAGAMEKRTWLMLLPTADWRWADTTQDAEGLEYSRWYPSVRIFRQSHDGGWEKVVAQVGHALDQWVDT